MRSSLSCDVTKRRLLVNDVLGQRVCLAFKDQTDVLTSTNCQSVHCVLRGAVTAEH